MVRMMILHFILSLTSSITAAKSPPATRSSNRGEYQAVKFAKFFTQTLAFEHRLCRWHEVRV